MNDELYPVYDAQSEIDALMARQVLEEAGLNVVEQVNQGEVFSDGPHSQLMVRLEDAETAIALLQEFEKEIVGDGLGYASDEDEDNTKTFEI